MPDTPPSRMTPFHDDVDELSAQRFLFAEFNDARSAGDKAEAARIARQFLSYAWKSEPLAGPSFAMRLFLERTDEAKREKDGHDNIAVLLNCLSGEWRNDLAVATLADIDRLVADGWVVGPDDREVIEKAKSRCRGHERARKREERWRKTCEDLAAAVKRSDAKALKRILASGEFRYREPEDDTLIWKAEKIIRGRGNHRMRRIVMPIAVSITAIVSVSLLVTQQIRERDYEQRLEAEVEKLDALKKMYDPIEQLSAELAYLRDEEPDLLANRSIHSYVDLLEDMREKNQARTNEIASLLADLEAVAAAGWVDADSRTIDKIERVDSIMLPHDVDYSVRLTKIKEAALASSKRAKDKGADEAAKYAARLKPIIEALSRRLDADLPDEELLSLCDKCIDALAKWDREYSKDAKDANASLVAPRRHFQEALRRQSDAVRALDAFKSATRAMDVVSLRQALRLKHSAYAPIAALQPLPYGEDDVREVLGNLSTRIVIDDGEERRTLRSYRASTAGKIMFDPMGKSFARNPTAIVPQVSVNADVTEPLYILRPENGSLVFRRALVMRNGRWAIVTHAIRNQILLGEPLFQIK